MWLPDGRKQKIGGGKMIYVAIVTGIIVAVAGWAICTSIPHDPGEDEEQEKYLEDWKRRHRK